MKFGILNDVLGRREGLPHIKLPSACVADETAWMAFRDGAMRRIPGRMAAFLSGGSPVQAPDGNPFMHWHYHRKTNDDETIFGFTKDHAYRWNPGTSAWVPAWTCSTSCTHWSTADCGPYVAATNQIDKVLKWTDTAPTDPFSVLGDADNGLDIGDSNWCTKANYLMEAENYLILFGTTDAGAYKPNRRRWCSWGDLTDWDSSATKSGDAGYNDLEPNNVISGCGIYSVGGATRVITFTQKLIDMMWLTEDVTVWNSETIITGIGCPAADSIIGEPGGNLYFLATDRTIRQLFASGPLSAPIAPTLRNLHPDKMKEASAVYVPELDQLWWSVAGKPDSTGNDLVLILDRQTGFWNTAPMDVRAFGYYRTQSAYTIDTIPFATIDTIAWPTIDYAGGGAGHPLLIASDHAGYGYSCLADTKDKGSAYTGVLALATDLARSAAVTEYKRVHGMWVFLLPGNPTDSVSVSIRPSHKGSYRFLKNVDLTDDGDGKEIVRWVPFDARCRHLCLKLESVSPFGAVGVVFDFDFDGDR